MIAAGIACFVACTEASPRTLCATTEHAYFDCATSEGKRISLCGRLPDRLQYRFGTARRTELAHPVRPETGTRELRFADYHRYQTNRSEVRLTVAEVEHTVFDGDESGKRSAGVAVSRRDSAGEHVYRCRNPIRGRLSDLKPFLACDADSALSMKTCR